MFTEPRQEFEFEWSHIGDIQLGRPNLGMTTNVAVYRLMQFTLRDAMVKHIGPEMASKIFYDAGKNAGVAFCNNVLKKPKDFSQFVADLQKALKDLSIGILRMEKSDTENLEFVLSVAEDLDCSGLPVMNEVVCTYDEGFIAGIFEAYTGRPHTAREVDCWGTGERVCRFEVKKA